MKILITLLGIIMMSISGFAQEKDGQILRLKPDLQKAGEMKMSELFSSITYIPLETKQECLIGYMNVSFFGKDLIVKTNTEGMSIFRFSQEGRFINKIGNTGRGPEEFADYSDILLSGDTVFVLSNFTREIICYSIKGTFLTRYKLETTGRPRSIVQLSDRSYLISLSDPDKIGNILKTDKNFKTISGMMPYVPLATNPLPFKFKRSFDKIFYYYNYIDTIFEVSKGYMIPSMIVDYGKYDAKKDLSTNAENNLILNKPSISEFNSSNYYYQLNIYYPYRNLSYTNLYRIADGKQVTWTKLINDLDDGALDRWAGRIVDNNMVFTLMPLTIIQRFNEMTEAEKLNPKNSGFVTMAEKITHESNPVIMICKLK